MNVLNYFLTLDNGQAICGPIGSKQECRGAETAHRAVASAAEAESGAVQLDADVFGMMELENTPERTGASTSIRPPTSSAG